MQCIQATLAGRSSGAPCAGNRIECICLITGDYCSNKCWNSTASTLQQTTNDNTNAWFIGFSPDIVVGVYIGYDEPKPLGKRETGSSAAVPIFEYFFKEYSKNKPDIPFRRPRGIRLIPIYVKNGMRANEIKEGVIQEAFKPGQFPENYILQGNNNSIREKSQDLELGIY